MAPGLLSSQGPLSFLGPEVRTLDNVYLVAAAWMGLALAASLVSIRLGISVALDDSAGGSREVELA